MGNRNGRLRARWNGLLLTWATKAVKLGLVRLRLANEEIVYEAIRQGRPIIFAGWHGHNFLTICAYYMYLQKLFKGTVVMVHENSNGDTLGYFGRKIGFETVPVNYEKGASQIARATVTTIKWIRGGYCALISPDGPEGPPYQAKPGIAVIGQQSRAVIIPASAAVSRGYRDKRRWDEHLIPRPLVRAVVSFSDAIDPCPEEGEPPTVEELQARIEAALLSGAERAEAMVRSRVVAGGGSQ